MTVNAKKSFNLFRNLYSDVSAQISLNKIENSIQHLKIAIVNLMPTVKETEKQWSEVLSYNDSVLVDLVFFHSLERPSTRVDKSYLQQNYANWQNYNFNNLDGIIITGAPVELLEFEEVDFYKEVCEIISKSLDHNLSLMLVCWAAQAGLNYLYNIEKQCLAHKLSGVYDHKFTKHDHPLLKGFTDNKIKICISRETKIDGTNVLKYTDNILSSSVDGLDCLADKRHDIIYMFNHLEYTENTLEVEYLRDLEDKKDIKKPHNYYDNENKVDYSWQRDREIFYSNWLDILKGNKS